MSALADLTRSGNDQWHVCSVVTTNGDGTVDLSYAGTVVDHVVCGNGFVPPVGSLVLVMTSDQIGWIVICQIPRRSIPDA